MAEKERKLGIWGKFLTLWVALCIGAGVGLGHLFPQLSDMLARLEVADVSIPIAILLFAMIYPIMVQISWGEIIKAARSPKPIGLTLIANWAIKPFTMAFFAWLFLSVIFGRFLDPAEIEQYRAGTILLGVAPCTAMVLVWSYLARGNMGHTLAMSAINSLTMVVLLCSSGRFTTRHCRYQRALGHYCPFRNHLHRNAPDSRLFYPPVGDTEKGGGVVRSQAGAQIG